MGRGGIGFPGQMGANVGAIRVNNFSRPANECG
jgi:hypothetical protein